MKSKNIVIIFVLISVFIIAIVTYTVYRSDHTANNIVGTYIDNMGPDQQLLVFTKDGYFSRSVQGIILEEGTYISNDEMIDLQINQQDDAIINTSAIHIKQNIYYYEPANGSVVLFEKIADVPTYIGNEQLQ